MRNLLVCLVAAAFFVAGCSPTASNSVGKAMIGQEASKALSTAQKAFKKYTYDRSANAGELSTAITSIGTAMADDGLKKNAAAWLLKGNIFNEVMSDPTGIFSLKHVDAVDKAYEAFQMVSKVGGGKKFELEAATKAMTNIAAGFSSKGASLFGNGDFKGAAAAFGKVLEVKKSLGLADDNNEEFQGDLYNAGLAAMNAGDNGMINNVMGRLLKVGYDKPNIYEGLYKANLDADPDKALGFLQQGREKHPENNSLLTTEINYYLKEGKLEVLEDKLLQALEADPKNKTLHMVTGSMYEKLAQNAAEAKAANEKEYFGKAEQYYNSAIALDGKYFDAIYSIGALYFNKTTPMREEMNNLALSEEARYNQLKDGVTGLMNKALPFFQKADGLNSQDYNTIFALKEIYARKDDLAKSNEYKVRLEALKK